MSEEEENSSNYSSSESSSASDEDLVEDIPDKDFFKTLSCLKNKDPRIYDNEVKFFTEEPLVIKSKNKHDPSATTALAHEGKNSANINKLSSNKFSLKDLDNESSSEDELMALKKSPNEPVNVENEIENEYIQFLKGKKTKLADKEVEQELKPLQNYWNTEVLDENEQFLRDYILNKKYLAPDAEINIENEDLSEDERELEEQAEFEANYNFRFETGENLQLKRFPRNIEGSMRRKNDARSKKRAELAQRKKEEKEKKFQDVKKKQKQKLSEIEVRLQKLKELTGNVELGFKDEEILEDFDPEKHDQKMKELFNDDYYSKEESEHPVFNEDDDNDYWENENIEDCEVEEKGKKLTRTQKKKLRKKKTYKDVMDIAKPSFDPKVHSDFKKYIDEYYSLDCEDFIDDLPCKFKYREVVPNDYGLSIEEILMADDSELNRWASYKNIYKRRPEHVEKSEVHIYKKKAQDETLKKKIFKSLYTDPPQDQVNDKFNDNDIPENTYSDRMYSEPGADSNTPKQTEDHTYEENVLLPDNSPEISQTFDQNAQKKKKKKRKRKNTEMDDQPSAQEVKELDESNTITKNKKRKTSVLNNSSNLTIDEDGENEDFTEHNGDGKEYKNNEIENLGETLPNNTSNSQKKKRRKKKKKKNTTNTSCENSINDSSQNKSTEGHAESKNEAEFPKSHISKKNKRKQLENVKVKKNKLKNKFGFKKKKNNVVNLSDSRLQAYGIKPKKFRAKIKYSQSNKTS